MECEARMQISIQSICTRKAYVSSHWSLLKSNNNNTLTHTKQFTRISLESLNSKYREQEYKNTFCMVGLACCICTLDLHWAKAMLHTVSIDKSQRNQNSFAVGAVFPSFR